MRARCLPDSRARGAGGLGGTIQTSWFTGDGGIRQGTVTIANKHAIAKSKDRASDSDRMREQGNHQTAQHAQPSAPQNDLMSSIGRRAPQALA
jgi:type IV secretory pathway TrbL component